MIKRPLRYFVVVTLIMLAFMAGLTIGTVVDQGSAAAATTSQATGLNFDLITQAWNTINQSFVDRQAIKPLDLTYGAITGMVDALGDTGHSRFLTPEMVQEQQSFQQGKFEGIGAEVEMKDGYVTIVAPFDNSPAQKAGLRPGDVIEKVDGKSVMGQQLSIVVHQILGPAGTQVTLTILDPKSGERREVTLTRSEVTVQNVTWQRLPGTTVAHLRIAGFSEHVDRDLRQALTEIQAQHLTGIILDLRNDPGGLLDEAVGSASQFLSSGNVLLVKDANGRQTPVAVQPRGVATTLPMVVLVNGGTASAAEIVAGALQDAHRATIIGSTTFGTGTVLQQFPLPGGSALLLATQEWLTPAGRVIWHKGIAPDIGVSLGLNATPSFPEAERDMTTAQLQASQDSQLLRGLSVLNHANLPTAKVPSGS